MEEGCRAKIGLRVPPVTGAGSATAGTQNAFVHPIQLSPIALGLRYLFPRGDRGSFPLQPRLNGLVLIIEVGHVHHQILNHKHMGKRRNGGGGRPIRINLSQASQAIAAVDVHGAGPTDPFPARPAEGQGWVDLILDLNQGVQHHGPTLLQVDVVIFELRLLGVVRVPSVDLEGLQAVSALRLGFHLLGLGLRCMGPAYHQFRRRS